MTSFFRDASNRQATGQRASLVRLNWDTWKAAAFGREPSRHDSFVSDYISALQRDQTMASEKDSFSLPQMQDQTPRCSKCAAFPRLHLKFLDPNRDKIIRLYRCECGERIWDN
jgi:hypothetical protein